MAALLPIPNTRVSGLLTRQRLLQQAQNDQLDLFRLQNQISTGRRINLPSEDAPAALRAVTLQRLLERKTQIGTNIATGQSFLAATDSSLNEIARLLGDIRGEALGVADTVSTDEQRDAVAAQVSRAIEQLVQVGNRQFRGRYLFAGSQTNVRPYEYVDGLIRYNGNEKEIRNFSDVDVLFSTSAAGQAVFGGIASRVVGEADLNPQLTYDTPLSSLRGGRGVSPNGSLSISDGTNTSIVDIGQASTIGDVVRLIETNAPQGRTVFASLTGQGLSLQLDQAGGGNLTVAEVGTGVAAKELGILELDGVFTNPLIGVDLDPAILRTTRLENLLGSKASARLTSTGNNNDVLLTASVNGPQYNGATIQVVDHDLLSASAGISKGNEFAEFDPAARAAVASLNFTGGGNDLQLTANVAGAALNDVKVFVAGQAGLGDAALASYDGATKRLTITVDDAGATTVQRVVDAVNGEGTFTAAHDSSVEASYNPAATIDPADFANVRGDTGKSGGDANTLYIYVENDRSTANDVIAAVNAEGSFVASIDPIDSNAAAAPGTGLISTGALTTASGGSGGSLDLASGIQVTNGGSVFTLDFSTSETVEDLLNVINGSGASLHAAISDSRTGIDIRSRLSGEALQIGENGGATATQLGVRTLTETQKLAELNFGVGVPVESGPDFTIITQDAGGLDVSFDVDVSTAETLQDVFDLINTHPANNTGGVAIRAQLATVGNGIELVDLNPTGSGNLTVREVKRSPAGEYLGLIAEGADENTASGGVLTGSDRNFIEVESVFHTLIRLQNALHEGDIEAMERAIGQIDGDISRATFARAEVGARQRALEVTQFGLEDEDVQLRAALSDELDVDLIEAISNLTARQSALQASLQVSATLLTASLFDFI